MFGGLGKENMHGARNDKEESKIPQLKLTVKAVVAQDRGIETPCSVWNKAMTSDFVSSHSYPNDGHPTIHRITKERERFGMWHWSFFMQVAWGWDHLVRLWFCLWQNPNFKTRKTLGRNGWHTREGKTITKHMPTLFPEMLEINEPLECDGRLWGAFGLRNSICFWKTVWELYF